MIPHRIARWSAAAVLVVGVAYAIVLAVGIARFGAAPIADPVLAIMEVLTMLSALPLLALVAALRTRAAPARRVCAALALACAALFAGTTCAVHLLELTAARQPGAGGLVWPSRSYAAELLAWDVFLGLALLFLVPVFGRGRERAVRRGLALCGALCLLGTIGPIVGDMRLQLVGVFGYAVVLPVVALLLLRLLARERATGATHHRMADPPAEPGPARAALQSRPDADDRACAPRPSDSE